MSRKIVLALTGIILCIPFASAYAASDPVGVFDGLGDGNTLYGWAYDPDQPTVSATVRLYFDGPRGTGTLGVTAITNKLREDVNSYIHSEGNHGFEIPIPAQYADGTTHNVYAYVVDTTRPSVSMLAWGSPVYFTLAKSTTTPPPSSVPPPPPPPTPTPPAPTPVPTPVPAPTPTVAPIANFDGTRPDGTTLYGWAYDPDVTSVSIAVQLYADGPKGTGVLATTSIANAPRPDVSSYFGITGNHGFEVPIPQVYRDGKSHTYYAYAQDTSSTTLLTLAWNSPKSATTGTPPPPPPPPNKIPAGNLDTLRMADSTLVGWAYDPDVATTSITLKLYIDGTKDTGTFIVATTTSVMRSDVNTSLGITGIHGFEVAIPAKYADGGGHTAFIYAVDTSSSTILTLLSNMPRSFSLVSPNAITKDSSTNTQPPVGNVDFARATDGMISGWSADLDQPTQPNTIRIYVDGPQGSGTLMATDTTTTYRSDVNNYFNIIGNHGFETFIPTTYRDGAAHTAYVYGVDVLVSTSTTLLSTKTFTMAVPATMTGPQICGIGMSLDGAEGGTMINATSYAPGTYAHPTASQLDYWHSKGFTSIRLLLAWEELQPALNGPLSTTALAWVKQFVSDAAARNMKVIIDVHNYGRYNGGLWSTTQYIGSTAVPISAFADLWTKLATTFVDNPGVASYDIMNEPHDMGSPSTWPAAAQAAVNAIRAVDTSTLILVEGDGFSNSQYWPLYNANFAINDPSHNFAYSAHVYLDQFGSGQYLDTYDDEHAGPTTGSDRLLPFANWLIQQGARGHVGEFSVPGNDTRWFTSLTNLMSTMKSYGIGGIYFTAGVPSIGQTFSVEPVGGVDQPQTPYLQQYTSSSCN